MVTFAFEQPIFSRLAVQVFHLTDTPELAIKSVTEFIENMGSSQLSREDEKESYRLTGMEYAEILQENLDTAISTKPAGWQQKASIQELQKQLLESYDDSMSAFVRHDNLYGDTDHFFEKHKEVAHGLISDFVQSLSTSWGLQTKEERWPYLLKLAEELGTHQRALFAKFDQKTREHNLELSNKLWNSRFDMAPASVWLNQGQDTARHVVDLIQSVEASYMKQARGPSKIRVFTSFVRAKGPWINSVINLSKLNSELDNDKLEEIKRLQDIVQKGNLERVAVIAEITQALEAQMTAGFEMLSAHAAANAESIMTEARAQMDLAQAELVRDASLATAEAQEATQNCLNEVSKISEQRKKDFTTMNESIDAIKKMSEESSANFEEKIKPKISWWEKALQIATGALMTVAGVALVALTGGAAAAVGGMLLSAGLSVTIQSSMSDVSWKDFGISVGVGLATGLICAGVGAAAGAVVKSVTVGMSLVKTVAVSAATHAATSAASGAVNTLISNACHNRPLTEGMGAACTVGAVFGAIGGGFAGKAVHANRLQKAAENVKEMAEVSAKQVAKEVAAGAVKGVGQGCVGNLIKDGMEGGVVLENLGQAAWMGAVGGAVGGLAGGLKQKHNVKKYNKNIQQKEAYDVVENTESPQGHESFDYEDNFDSVNQTQEQAAVDELNTQKENGLKPVGYRGVSHEAADGYATLPNDDIHAATVENLNDTYPIERHRGVYTTPSGAHAINYAEQHDFADTGALKPSNQRGQVGVVMVGKDHPVVKLPTSMDQNHLTAPTHQAAQDHFGNQFSYGGQISTDIPMHEVVVNPDHFFEAGRFVPVPRQNIRQNDYRDPGIPNQIRANIQNEPVYTHRVRLNPSVIPDPVQMPLDILVGPLTFIHFHRIY
jgi:hypothetical protein